MRKALCLVFLFSAAGFCDLPILRTSLRSAGIDVVQAQARANNPEAMIELALRYYAGYQVDRNPAEAFKWMSAAAGLDEPEAMALLSRMYAGGIGTEIDPVKSEEWFARALAGKPHDVQLQEQYAQLIAEKDGDPEALLDFLKRCADAGHIPALTALKRPEAIKLYAQEDYETAAGIFKNLAAAQDPVGMYFLARMYFLGLGGLPQDEIEAIDFYVKAAEGGSVGAQYELARLYESGTAVEQDSERAAFWFEKAAANGHAGAQYKMAEIKFAEACLWQERTDTHAKREAAAALTKAVDLYRLAAAAGNSGAQYALGRLYASGEGVARNHEEAVRWYDSAAAQNHADAIFYLGLMHHAGFGVPRDPEQAAELYKKAFSAGSRGAAFYLGNLHRSGTLVEKNPRKGADIYRKKVLDGITAGDENSVLLRDIWVLRAALEYGIIQFRRGDADAAQWISLAAGAGISGAREALVKTAMEPAPELLETTVAPMNDAVELRRDQSIIFPCIEEQHRKIFPNVPLQRVIHSAIERNTATDFSGNRQWGLIVNYKSPVIDKNVGLNGVIQVGIEFEDTKTGAQYWSFNRLADPRTVSSGDVVTELSVFLNLNGYPNLRLKNWLVEYGHLFSDERLFGILDAKQKSGAAGTLEQMAFRNRATKQIPATIVVIEDLSRLNSGTVDSAVPGSDGEESSSFFGF